MFTTTFVPSLGVLLVNRSSFVLEMNTRAHSMLGRCGAIEVRDGKIACGCSSDSCALQAAIARAASADDGEIGTRGGMISIERDGRRSLNVAVAAAPRDLVGSAVVFIIDPECFPVNLEEQLRRSYGLSAAERRVATLLCQGLSIDAISEECGTLRETVRTQVKRILTKTGTCRQSELVSLLMGGVLRVDVTDKPTDA